MRILDLTLFCGCVAENFLYPASRKQPIQVPPIASAFVQIIENKTAVAKNRHDSVVLPARLKREIPCSTPPDSYTVPCKSGMIQRSFPVSPAFSAAASPAATYIGLV
jgi:hypothetical protein